MLTVILRNDYDNCTGLPFFFQRVVLGSLGTRLQEDAGLRIWVTRFSLSSWSCAGLAVLKGSWDLVTRVIIRVTILITPITILITLLTKSHDPPSTGISDFGL